jgi:hypothetical protein
LLVEGRPVSGLRHDIEISQNRCAVDGHIENARAGARILYFREFQRELIVAVRDRNGVVEIAVISLPPQR